MTKELIEKMDGFAENKHISKEDWGRYLVMNFPKLRALALAGIELAEAVEKMEVMEDWGEEKDPVGIGIVANTHWLSQCKTALSKYREQTK